MQRKFLVKISTYPGFIPFRTIPVDFGLKESKGEKWVSRGELMPDCRAQAPRNSLRPLDYLPPGPGRVMVYMVPKAFRGIGGRAIPMHEYSLMQTIVQAILQRLAEEDASEPVAEVVLELGILEIHSEAAGRQAFEVLTRGTPLENSRLTLKIRPVFLECPDCRVTTPIPADENLQVQGLWPAVPCPVCGSLARLTGGQGVGPIELIFAGSSAPA